MTYKTYHWNLPKNYELDLWVWDHAWYKGYFWPRTTVNLIYGWQWTQIEIFNLKITFFKRRNKVIIGKVTEDNEMIVPVKEKNESN